ncbi:MAG: STAS domain-containing protein [Spirochaetales bacterium]|nr:STAS domain-containing protein [Sphaerochaetaceae bacterium]MDD3981338.1 STAS domain-containing protein [Spirochaetales bacterium]
MPSRLIARASASPDKKSASALAELEIESLAELPGALVCRPGGNIGAERVVALHDAIVTALSEKKSILVFDLARTEDLDSAGVGLLVALQKLLRERSGDLILVGMRPKLLRVLETLGFGEFFSFSLDRRHALEYIQGMKRDIFPISAPCPACSAPLGLQGPGRSRCRACQAVLTVLADGSVELG